MNLDPQALKHGPKHTPKPTRPMLPPKTVGKAVGTMKALENRRLSLLRLRRDDTAAAP